MVTFLVSIAALVLGYFLYGALVEKVFAPDSGRKTPAYEKADGVDYVPMPTWKVFMIQFLNIAGTGPIFGAILGAKFGPACYLWIVFGCIFAGAVHDYMSGMLSVRSGGLSVPNIVGQFLGRGAKGVLLVFSVILLLLVGAVFVYSPAEILGGEMNFGLANADAAIMIWVLVVFAYYIIATLVPVDKLIGRFYPIFAFSLLFMAVALFLCLLVKWPSIPEIGSALSPAGGGSRIDASPIFPCLFITVACGAISGFHSNQSPIMARCLKNEKHGRPIFYGAMITEGIVALIWAAVASWFFYDGGAAAVGVDLANAGKGADPASIVRLVSKDWLGVFGGILAILGVVAAPITSGDTALRSARLIISDAIGLEQKKPSHRLAISIPVFAVVGLLLWLSISKPDGFTIIWRYFGWANQTLAVFVLWAATVYLLREKGGAAYLITLLPACLMTAVVVTFICISKIGFNLPQSIVPALGALTFTVSLALFLSLKNKIKKS